jgi:nicotinic acid phosphoribosyltransferase
MNELPLWELKREALAMNYQALHDLRFSPAAHRDLSLSLADKYLNWLKQCQINDMDYVSDPFTTVLQLFGHQVVITFDGHWWRASIPETWWIVIMRSLPDFTAYILKKLPKPINPSQQGNLSEPE